MKRASFAVAAMFLTIVQVHDGAAAPSSLDRCLSVLARSAFKLTEKWGRCVAACEDARRKGELAASTSCSFPSDHAPTQACLLRAAERLTGARSRARQLCRDSDVALWFGGSSTCLAQNETADELLACTQQSIDFLVGAIAQMIYDPVRPSLCGDGRIAPSEQCDPNAFPDGCSSAEVCHPDLCFCIFAGCGNGLLEPGEDCDPSAFPNGCSFDELCDFSTCECRAFGSASEAFLERPESLVP